MTQFLNVGDKYLNVDKIAHVDVEGPPAHQVLTCTVWFMGGGQRVFKGDDAKRVLEYLNKNKAD